MLPGLGHRDADSSWRDSGDFGAGEIVTMDFPGALPKARAGIRDGGAISGARLRAGGLELFRNHCYLPAVIYALAQILEQIILG